MKKQKLVYGRCAMFVGRNARARALGWSKSGEGRTAYFSERGRINSTDGFSIFEGFSYGTDAGGHWWSGRLSVRERMAQLIATGK